MEAARDFAEPANRIIISERSKTAAVAYLVRPDDTAYKRLDVVGLSDSSWRVQATDSCAGEELAQLPAD